MCGERVDKSVRAGLLVLSFSLVNLMHAQAPDPPGTSPTATTTHAATPATDSTTATGSPASKEQPKPAEPLLELVNKLLNDAEKRANPKNKDSTVNNDQAGAKVFFVNRRAEIESARLSATEIAALPLSFFLTSPEQMLELCRSTVTLTDEDRKTYKKAVEYLEEVCGKAGTRAAVGGGFAMNAIQGLGDFLIERAKKEVLLYATEQLSNRLCCEDEERRTTGTAVQLFSRTCHTLYPDESKPCLFDVTAFTSGAGVAALREDVETAPEWILKSYGHNFSATERPIWDKLSEALVAEFPRLRKGGAPSQFLLGVADRLDVTLQGLDSQKLACDLTDAKKPSPTCIALLVVELGREGAHQDATSPSVPSWIENAASAFCSRYSAKEGSSCIVDANYAENWHRTMLAGIDVITNFKKVETTIQEGRKASLSNDAEAKIVAAALGSSIDALRDFVISVLTVKTDQCARCPTLHIGFDLASAVVTRDRGRIQNILLDWLALDAPELSQWIELAVAATEKDVDRTAQLVLKTVGDTFQGEEREVWNKISEAFGSEFASLGTGATPTGVLAAIAGKLDTSLQGLQPQTLECDLTNAARTNPTCLALLVIEVGRAGKDEHDPRKCIEAAGAKYCANYSTKMGTSCIVADERFAAWTRILDAGEKALTTFETLDKAIDAALQGKDKKSGDALLKAVAAQLGDSIDALRDFTLVVLGSRTENPCTRCGRINNGFDLASGIARRDRKKVESTLLAWLDAEGDRQWLKAAQFAVAVGNSETSDDVKDALEQFAAPIGSYSAKYSTDRQRRWAINAFVGGFFGYQSSGTVAPTGDGSFSVARLTAPVGFDLTLRSRPRSHFGLFFPIADPLTITMAGKGSEQADADWRAVVSPGIYARWGIGRSPFAVMLGGTWQPALRSNEMCGTERCWEDALQYGVAVAVDVPLLFLH